MEPWAVTKSFWQAIYSTGSYTILPENTENPCFQRNSLPTPILQGPCQLGMVCIYTLVCIHIYIHIQFHTYISMYIQIFIMHKVTYIHIYRLTYLHIHKYCIYTHIYIQIYTKIYTLFIFIICMYMPICRFTYIHILMHLYVCKMIHV